MSTMLKTWIRIVFTLSAFASPCIAEDVPFKLEQGLIIISTKIMKGDPVEAIVSTGTPESFLSADYIFKRKIRLGYTNDGPVTGHNDKIMLFADVPDILVGDQKAVSLKMKQRSLAEISKAVGHEVDMILGADYFRGKIIQIDFKTNIIHFFEKSPLDYKTSKTSVTDSGPVSLFFKMDKPMQNFFGVGLTLPVVEDVSFVGSKIRTLFDTGESSAPFAMSFPAAKRLGLSPLPDKGISKASQIKSISLNGYQIDQIPVLLVGKEAGFDQDISDYGAVLGIKVLKNFLVTFDWKEKMIVLER